MAIRQGTLEGLELNPDFWRGKRVLLTGHTGFKGSWLALWLQRLGAEVSGIALPPSTMPNLFELAQVAKNMKSQFCDIRNFDQLEKLVRSSSPEIIIHLAAQPLVTASYQEPIATFSANVMGTAHLLEALRGLDSIRVAVMVTTDKVYRNVECQYPYREDDALGGHDPYSASKAASEIVISCYRDAFLREQGLAVASARAGNVIGGGDWSDHRLIPDAIRAWQAGEVLEIRRPSSIRPWQHVLEPLYGYLSLAEKLWNYPVLASAYNFGPYTHEVATVRELVELAREMFGGGAVSYGDGRSGHHEAGWLALEVAKARADLGFRPKWNFYETVDRTISWYRQQSLGVNACDLCVAEIEAYEFCESKL